MKVVFVDLEGTLRSDASIKFWRQVGRDISLPHPDALKLLEQLISSSGAKLVITGKDRSLDTKELKDLFNTEHITVPLPELLKIGTKKDSVLITNFLDTTPILRNGTRGDEIRKFLMHHSGRIRNYVVLDASDDLDPIESDYVITVDPEKGLEKEHIAEAISRLR